MSESVKANLAASRSTRDSPGSSAASSAVVQQSLPLAEVGRGELNEICARHRLAGTGDRDERAVAFPPAQFGHGRRVEDRKGGRGAREQAKLGSLPVAVDRDQAGSNGRCRGDGVPAYAGGAAERDDAARSRTQSTRERFDRVLESHRHRQRVLEWRWTLAGEQEPGRGRETERRVRRGAGFEQSARDECGTIFDRGRAVDAVGREQEVDDRGRGVPFRRVVVGAPENDRELGIRLPPPGRGDEGLLAGREPECRRDPRKRAARGGREELGDAFHFLVARRRSCPDSA